LGRIEPRSLVGEDGVAGTEESTFPLSMHLKALSQTLGSRTLLGLLLGCRACPIGTESTFPVSMRLVALSQTLGLRRHVVLKGITGAAQKAINGRACRCILKHSVKRWD
jgi:hypothetical protein